MIYTLTLNPAIDYYMYTDELREGSTNRSKKEALHFGGKGINVSVILSRLGIESIALGFIAGFTGDALQSELSAVGVKTDFIKLKSGLTRINLKIKGSAETEINASGPQISDTDTAELFSQLGKLKNGDTLILSGSIPPTMPQDIYSQICSMLTKKGIKVAVDASRELLLQVLKFRPFVIKPNLHELEETLGKSLETDEEVIDGAKKLKALGAENVLVSLGKRGAILIDSDGTVHKANAVGGKAINTVGAGDSMLAGFIAGLEKGSDYALRLALASGGATACSERLAEKSDILKLM